MVHLTATFAAGSRLYDNRSNVSTLRNSILAICVLGPQLFAPQASAQTGKPVIYSRGVVDAMRQDPAPATVARGGMLQITGFGLGPSTAVKAKGATLPTSLGDPAVQVLINGTPADLYSVSSDTVLARVPVDAAIGAAKIQVSVGGVSSETRTVTIAAVNPGVSTVDGSGYGAVAGNTSKSPAVLVVHGLGAANPRPGTVTAYVGGVPAKVTTVESKAVPGQFDTSVEIPGKARPGDLVYLAETARAANLVTLQQASAPTAKFVALPAGAPDLSALSTPDVTGAYVLATAARGTDGCYKSYAFDMSSGSATAIDPCLIAPANSATPFVNSPTTEFAAALVGPAAGTAPAGISKKAFILTPGSAPKSVDLSGAATALASVGGGTFTAVIPATDSTKASVDTITASTGAVRNAAAQAGGAGGAAVPLSVDGLTKALTARIQIPGSGGNTALVVGDATTAPKTFEFAILKANGDKVSSASFPSGLVPLLAPQAPGPNGAAPNVTAATGLAFYVAAKSQVWVAAKMPDDSVHRFLAFPVEGGDPTVVPLPDGWFLSACTNSIRTYNFVLGERIGLFGSQSGDNAYKASCPASGYLELDPATGEITAIRAGQTPDLVTGTQTGTFNDFLWSTNFTATSRTSSAVHALDGADATAIRIDLPAGTTAIQTVSAIPQINSLIAPAQKRVVGDDGFALFSLADGTSKRLALPDGFATVSLVGFFPATRKIVARGISSDRKTSNLIIYDLTGASTVVANPDGVASLGGKPGAASTPRLLVAHPNSNSVAAAAYDANGNQTGVVLVTIP